MSSEIDESEQMKPKLISQIITGKIEKETTRQEETKAHELKEQLKSQDASVFEVESNHLIQSTRKQLKEVKYIPELKAQEEGWNQRQTRFERSTLAASPKTAGKDAIASTIMAKGKKKD